MFSFPWSRTATTQRLPGGLHLDGHKRESTDQPVRPLDLPGQLILPLTQHHGNPAKPLVAVGDTVAKGQPVARADGVISAFIHAPSSGEVVGLDNHPIPHPSGLSSPCLIIATDGTERWAELPEPWPDFRERNPQSLRQRIRESGIVGLGGASFPTAVKLNPISAQTPELLVINGAECEPYISCDEMLMRERPQAIVQGVEILCHILGVARAVIAVEDDKPQAIEALRPCLGSEAPISLKVIPTRYPTGGEKQLIQILTGRQVPSGGLPGDIGVVCQNVATAAAVADAVLRGRPLISRYVTVTGDGSVRPQVREVLLGTPVAELIAQCGGYRDNARQLLVGGPMMGFALEHDRVPVTKACNCLLIRADAPAVEATQPCIRCGQCHEVCPVGLLPQQLYWHSRARDLEKTQAYHLFDCIECGCCASVCPSHIPLVHYYRFAKTEIWNQTRERRQADIARDRHTARQARQAREQAERAARHRRNKAPLGNPEDHKQAAIQAARERARQRRAGRTTLTDDSAD